MFTVLIRTSNRPRAFARCIESVRGQTIPPYIITSTDDPTDTYPEGDYVLKVDREIGRGSNLYFNTMRFFVPQTHPFVIHLDDDDRFTTPHALEIIREAIFTSSTMVLWQVRAGHRLIPEMVGEPPVFGHITGIGFAVHVRHWINWRSVPGGDFLIIDEYYKRLKPVWIDQVLTEFQGEPGGGRREDL